MDTWSLLRATIIRLAWLKRLVLKRRSIDEAMTNYRMHLSDRKRDDKVSLGILNMTKITFNTTHERKVQLLLLLVARESAKCYYFTKI